MKREKVTRIIIFMLIALIIILVAICILVKKLNSGYPEKYIREHYSDAEIISKSETGDVILNPYKKIYVCLDKEHNFVFYQNFRQKGWILKLDHADENDSENSYNDMLKKSDTLVKCTDLVKEQVKNKCFTRINPDNSAGFIVFMEKSDMSGVLESVDSIDKIIDDEHKTSGVYIKYTVIVCDKNLYQLCSQSEEKPLNSVGSTVDVTGMIKIFVQKETQHIKTYDESEFSPDASENTFFAIGGENNHTGPHKIMTYKIL